MTEDSGAVPAPKPNKWVQYGGWVLGVIASLLTAAGYLSPEQVKTIKEAVVAKPVDEPVANPAVGAMSPEDIKQWTEQLKIIVDELKKLKPPPAPKPEPAPVPVPVPVPTPPQPTPPVVDPVPVDPAPNQTLKILISDETEKPLTATSVDAGRLFMVTANTKEKVGWAVSKHGDVRLLVLPNNLGYAFSLQGDSFVEFFLTDSDLKAVSTRISCNQGPQPPPIVDPTPGPKPDPAPAPPVPKAEKLKLSVVYDVKNITPETAKVLAATDIWTGLEKHGHKWIFYSNKSNEPGAIQAKADAGESGLPKLVIYDLTTGVKLGVVPLPAVDEIMDVVKYYGGSSE